MVLISRLATGPEIGPNTGFAVQPNGHYTRPRRGGLSFTRAVAVLSQTCEYALRAVVHIARQNGQEPVLAKDIAAATRVPLKYLQKILRDLVRAGLLGSTRGIRGGFCLKHPAADITLAEVIAPFDDPNRRKACPFGNLHCGCENPCPVHERWERVLDVYQNFVQSTTLADVVQGDHPHPAGC